MADYYVDENGTITKKKKKRQDNSNISYVVSEDGTISEYKSFNTELNNQFDQAASFGRDKWTSTLLGQTSQQSTTPYAPGMELKQDEKKQYREDFLRGEVTYSFPDTSDVSLEQMGNVVNSLKNGGIVYISFNGKTERVFYDDEGNIVTESGETIFSPPKEVEKKEKERTLFQAGAFEDGFEVLDIPKAILATGGDIVGNTVKGFLGGAEGVADFLAYGVSGGADLLGFDDYAEDVRDRAAENFYGDMMDDLMDDIGITENSVLGDKADALPNAVGNVGFMLAGGAAGKVLGMGAKGAALLGNSTVFSSSMGNAMSEAYQNGASDGEAFAYGVTSGTIDLITERMFSGLGKIGGEALGKPISAADDALAQRVGKAVAKKFGEGKGAHVFKTLAQASIKAGAEGSEELAAGILSAGAKKLTYMSDEEIGTLLADENLLEQFIIGTLTSGIMQSSNVKNANKNKTDLISGMTYDEEAVFEKELEKRIADAEEERELSAKEKTQIRDQLLKDFDEGGISIDTIEEALGGDTYKEYQDTVANEEAQIEDIEAQLKELEDAPNTVGNAKKYEALESKLEELKNNSQADEIRQRLSDEVFTRAKDSRLVESYAERERRKQKYEADLSKYDTKQQETIRRAIDSGILNNTRKTHKFMDMIAKISADKGVSFDFTNNAKLKESGFAVDGRQVNGYVTANGVTVNINSNKALNSVVGHEITHVLEGTALYTELQNAVKLYAESKGDYKSRVDAITKLYDGMDADIDAEVTADLVGDYLFTDPDFIQRLSTEHRNVFQKVYAEIKYLAKVATAGSKEARQLEKAKKVFEDAYRESGKAGDAKADSFGETKYSISVTDKATIDFLENQEHITTYKAMQVIDGNLYPPMAAKVKDENGKYRLTNPSKLGVWQQATEDTKNIKKIKNGVGYYTLNKGDGTSIDAAYNPYEHSSNLVLNDQFESAHRRDNLVVVECVIPVSEMTSGYKAEYAKDATGVMDWKAGVVAGKIKDNKRQVYLSRYLKPVRILSDAEVATKYKEILDGTGVSVPFNVVQPSLLAELEKAGVEIDYEGSPMYKANQKRAAEKDGKKTSEIAQSRYSLSADTEGIDSYSEEQYNAFGWASYNDVITAKERQVLFSRYADFRHNRNKYPVTRWGEAVIHSTECPDAIVYVKGSIDSPDVTRIIRIKADDSADVYAIQERIVANEFEQKPFPYEAIEAYYGAEYLEFHRKRDYASFRQYQDAIREGRGRQESNPVGEELQDGEGSNRGGRASNQADGGISAGNVTEQKTSSSDGVFFDATTHHSISESNNNGRVGDIAPAVGSYNVYGKDIALEAQDDIAPIRDDLAPVQDSVQPTVQESDFAPTTEAEANALADEALPTFTDEDAPPMPETEYDDFADTTALDPKALKDISKALKDVLYLNNKEVKAIGEVVQKYSTTEFPDKADLFYELQAKFGTKETVERNEETAAIKKTLREYPINVSQAIKKDITDYGAFMRRNFGKVRFSKEGVPVDSAYQDLSSMFPGYFPADITNASDQLMRIAEVAGMEINETETFELSDEDIMEAVDVIEAEVGKYKEAAVQTAAEADRQAAFAHIDDIAPIRDDIAPAVDIPAPADTSKPIKTVKERLSAKLQNYQTELATNQQQRIDSQASYEEEISRLYAEYSGKKNKNTKAANDILRRIDRLQTMKGNVDADYAKRISDLEAKVAQLTEEVRTGESPTEQAAMRQEVHAAIVDNIKTTFAEKGIDFDKVLENAKDLSTFSTVDNTPQRVLEKALGYKEGQILSDLTVNKVAQSETEGIKWLNSFTDRKNGLLAQISKQYHIKPGSKQSAAAQMYAEGFYVNDNNDIVQYGDAELAKDFPDVTIQDRIKGLAKDPRIRQIYDETLAAINESRARNGYPEIQRLDNYFLHFRAQTDTFSRLGIPFNPKDIRAKDLPTDLNGVTADLKPGQPYFASAMHRKGKRTSFDLLGGLEQYLTSAKDQIYHIDDIQTLRALRNYIADNYGQAKGLDNLDALTEEEAEAKIKEVFNGHLSTMAKFLNEEANVIAGKTALTDRGLEGVIGRRGITFLADLNKQVGANMVGFNISSSMTNFLATVQGFAKTNKRDFVKGFAQMTANKIKSIGGKGDGFAEQSPVIIRRKGADRFHRTAWQKTSDAGYVLMSAVDNVSTELLARAKYNELTRKGMDAQQAHQETDKWVSRLMGDRSLGQQPQLYNSKMLGMLTKFQLEVRNQLDAQFYDTIKEAQVETEDIENALKRNSKKAAKITSVFLQLAIGQHLFGKAFEAIAGYNPAFDIISVLMKTFGWDDDEDDDDTALDNLEQGFMELLGDLPYTSTFTGGRIPISSALPVEQFVTGKDQYGNEKSRWETIKEAAPYYFLPGGYGQIKKTTQGLSMFSEKDKPYYFEVDEDGDISKNFVTGSYTDSGNLRYPVEKNFGNVLQAALFGQYANKNAREYFDDDIAPLKENQIVEYDMLDIPIADYWKYRKGLAKQDTLEEKLDYIDDLDLPIDKKNILANNVANRESYIDLSDYDDFSGLEEFDFATKNPEKYDFFEQSGITYEAYAKGDEDAKRAYNWAYENPEKYIVSQAVASDVVEYRQYARELSEINSKDENGETVNGLAKQRKFAYISGLDIDAGAKAILFKMEYPASYVEDNTFILQYIDSLEALTVDDKLTIARELGFTVNADGSVYW